MNIVVIYVWVTSAVDSINKVTQELNTYDIPPSRLSQSPFQFFSRGSYASPPMHRLLFEIDLWTNLSV